jgi:YVTN family beta-propeller protein
LDRGTSNRPQPGRLPRRLVALGGALAVAAGLVAATAPAASAADSTTYIEGVERVGDVAAGGGRVFVAAYDRIVVTDTRGTLTGAITGLSGAVGLAVTPDGTRLYAALSGSNEVAEIDTAALTVTRRFDLGAYQCPTHLSLAGSRLWVGYGCAALHNGGVLGLDLSAPAPEPVQIAFNMYGAPLVVAAGNTVVTGETGLSPGSLSVYDVSATPATLRGEISGHTYRLSDLNDLAITPDGSTVISAFGTPDQFDAWDTTSLTKVRTYGGGPYSGPSRAVAISPDGAHIAGGGQPVSVYDAATTAETYTDVSPGGELVYRSLTFSGTDIFGVLEDWSTRRFHLWRLEGALLPASTLTLTPPSGATALEPLTVTGQLTLADGSAPGAQPLVVTRQLPDGTRATLDGVTTAADGTFTITDTPPVSGEIRYDVLWDGNSAFRWSTASVTITVAKHASSLTLSGPATGTAGQPLQLSGVLDLGGLTPPPGATIDVVRTVSNRKGTVSTLLPAVTPASDGSFSFVDTPTVGGQYTYTVYWYSTDAFSPAQASHDVTVRGGLG